MVPAIPLRVRVLGTAGGAGAIPATAGRSGRRRCGPHAASRRTFGQYAADYLTWSATVHRSPTIRNEVARLVAVWAAQPLETITTAEVERFLAGLRAGELSPTSVNRFRDRISGMFKRALRLGLVDRNPASGIPKAKEAGGGASCT